jgi:hypothetical protein
MPEHSRVRVTDASKPLPTKPATYNQTLAKAELLVHFPPRGELGGAGGLSELPSAWNISEADRKSLAAVLWQRVLDKHSYP